MAHVLGIELQRRGLPHANCMFILSQTSKNALRNSKRADTIFSAERPSESDNDLRKFVLQLMIHDTCGSQNRAAVRMRDRKCNKTF